MFSLAGVKKYTIVVEIKAEKPCVQKLMPNANSVITNEICGLLVKSVITPHKISNGIR